MRLLMLGWEFPPFISGGLGTACYGLVRAMGRLKKMETVLAALNRCRKRMQRTGVWSTHPLGDEHERRAFFETVQTNPLVLAGR